MQELKAELSSLKEASKEDKKSQTELTQKVNDLSEELTKEKVSFVSHLVCCFLGHFSFKRLHTQVTLTVKSNVENCSPFKQQLIKSHPISLH